MFAGLKNSVMQIKKFTFNPFQENTYILYDDSLECAIVDPGCYTDSEKKQISDFISQEKLVPTLLLNTHCHIDHILGNKFISELYKIPLDAHQKEIPILSGSPAWGMQYGIMCELSPEITNFVDEGYVLSCGNFTLEVLFVPGHSPGHVAFVNDASKSIISGDVLFHGGYGRVDLPGGNLKDLVASITQKLFKLPDNYTVYSGHGGETTIGAEKMDNPILHY